MLIVIGRDDRNVQLQEEEEGSGSNTGSGSSGEESDGEDELPFSMSRAGLAVLIFGLLVAGVGILLVWFFWRRQFRIQGNRPRQKPAFIQKIQQFWCKWIPCTKNRGYRSCGLQQEGQGHARYSGGSMMESEMQEHPRTSDPAIGIGRSTSERSVLTLPAYTSSARPTERIIGREGERGGVDVVLEYPETADEEESRREQDMASLYNIRLARRAEREARGQEEEHRRLQPQRQSQSGTLAHSRGSSSSMLDVTAAASQPQNRNSTGNQSTSSETLLANHQAALLNRERRTSSVAYSRLGVAHHDGTRIHSTNGDAGSSTIATDAADLDGRSTADMPLLGSAASMGGTAGQNSRRVSGVSTVSMISRGSAAGPAHSAPGGITTPSSTQRSGGSSSSSNGMRTSSNDSTSANGAAAILTPPALSDEDSNGVVVVTPSEDHTSNSLSPPQYDAPPPTYEDPDPAPTAQQQAFPSSSLPSSSGGSTARPTP